MKLKQEKSNIEEMLMKGLETNPNKRKRGRPKKSASPEKEEDANKYTGTKLEQYDKRGYKIGIKLQEIHGNAKGIIVGVPFEEIQYNKIFIKVSVKTTFGETMPMIVFDPNLNIWAPKLKA